MYLYIAICYPTVVPDRLRYMYSVPTSLIYVCDLHSLIKPIEIGHTIGELENI